MPIICRLKLWNKVKYVTYFNVLEKVLPQNMFILNVFNKSLEVIRGESFKFEMNFFFDNMVYVWDTTTIIISEI